MYTFEEMNMKSFALVCVVLTNLSIGITPLVKEYTLKGVPSTQFILTKWQDQYRLNGMLLFRVCILSSYYHSLRLYKPLIIPSDAPESEIVKLLYETFHKKVIVNKKIMFWD